MSISKWNTLETKFVVHRIFLNLVFGLASLLTSATYAQKNENRNSISEGKIILSIRKDMRLAVGSEGESQEAWERLRRAPKDLLVKEIKYSLSLNPQQQESASWVIAELNLVELTKDLEALIHVSEDYLPVLAYTKISGGRNVVRFRKFYLQELVRTTSSAKKMALLDGLAQMKGSVGGDIYSSLMESKRSNLLRSAFNHFLSTRDQLSSDDKSFRFIKSFVAYDPQIRVLAYQTYANLSQVEKKPMRPLLTTRLCKMEPLEAIKRVCLSALAEEKINGKKSDRKTASSEKSKEDDGDSDLSPSEIDLFYKSAIYKTLYALDVARKNNPKDDSLCPNCSFTLDQYGDQAPPECQKKYDQLFEKENIDVKITLGYYDAPDAPGLRNLALDSYIESAIEDQLDQPCFEGYEAKVCGFTKVESEVNPQDNRPVPTKWIRPVWIPSGKTDEKGEPILIRKTMTVHLMRSSESAKDSDNRGANKEKQGARTKAAMDFFRESLSDGTDVSIYLGHSRNGGGPSTGPAITTNNRNDTCPKAMDSKYGQDLEFLNSGDVKKERRIAYKCYTNSKASKSAGLSKKAMIDKLKESESKPKILAMLSCSSTDHFYNGIHRSSDKTSFVGSRDSSFHSGASVAGAISLLDNILNRRCEPQFSCALNRYQEMDAREVKGTSESKPICEKNSTQAPGSLMLKNFWNSEGKK